MFLDELEQYLWRFEIQLAYLLDKKNYLRFFQNLYVPVQSCQQFYSYNV